MKIQIIPKDGDPYFVTIEVPTGTDDLDTFLLEWIDSNLTGVSWYKIIRA